MEQGFWRACGASAIIERDGKVLLVLNRYRKRETWSLPGGGADEGEWITDTLRREVREEVGLDVEVDGLAYTTETRLNDPNFKSPYLWFTFLAACQGDPKRAGTTWSAASPGWRPQTCPSTSRTPSICGRWRTALGATTCTPAPTWSPSIPGNTYANDRCMDNNFR